MQQAVRHNSTQAGFTLVEVAIVVAIAGLLIGGYFAFLTSMAQQRNMQVTEQRMQKIANALSDFAQRNGNLPCAAPIVAGAFPLGTASAACTALNSEGVVPFRDLGLTQQDATDGWGGAFTYRVQRDAVAPFTGASQAHFNMRLDNTWVNVVGAPVSMNPRKAVFCGRSLALPALNVQEVTPPIAAPQPVVPAQAIGGGTMNLPDVNSGPTANGDQLRFVAYVLVSAGPNQEQTFLWDLAARRPNMNAQPADLENSDGDVDFVIRPRRDAPGANFYDDVILWRSQFDVIRELGNDSCARA